MLDYISELFAFIAGGLAGSLLTITVTKFRASGRASIADQRGGKAGGDIVGRDKISK